MINMLLTDSCFACRVIKRLVTNLDIQILAPSLCKMRIFYEPKQKKKS